MTAGSAIVDIYQQEAGCKHITPDLQPKIDEGKKLHEEILKMKYKINTAWGPGQFNYFFKTKEDSKVDLQKLFELTVN